MRILPYCGVVFGFSIAVLQDFWRPLEPTGSQFLVAQPDSFTARAEPAWDIDGPEGFSVEMTNLVTTNGH